MARGDRLRGFAGQSMALRRTAPPSFLGTRDSLLGDTGFTATVACEVYLFAYGAGASGGSNVSGVFFAAGGGGGAAAFRRFSLAAGEHIGWTAGAGAAGVTGSPVDGNPGGDTTVTYRGANLVVGGGGAGTAPGGGNGIGGPGGIVGPGWDITRPGGAGGAPGVAGGSPVGGGAGGAGSGAGGGGGGAGFTDRIVGATTPGAGSGGNTGGAGGSPSGGSGGVSSGTSGAGGSGRVLAYIFSGSS